MNTWGNTLAQVLIVCVTLVVVIHLLFAPKDAHSRRKPRVELAGTTPLEARFFTALRDRQARGWSLADAFFIASGIRSEGDLERARKWFRGLVEEARVAVQSHRGVSKRADHLLRWLHQRALSRYQARSTSALELIRTGQFNCLSSCILYGMIGEELGLHVRGIVVDQHAFCRVYQKPQPRRRSSMTSRAGGWDVETTTPLGFNPGRSVQIDQAVVSVPRHRYRNRREISLFEMIGLIYTNHVGMTRAYPTLEDRLLAYQKASLFFPRDPVIKHNVVAAHTQLIASAIDRGRWERASSYLKQLADVDPQGAEATQLWISLLNRHLSSLASRGLEVVLSTIRDYKNQEPQLPGALWSLLEAKYLGNVAATLLSKEESPEGLRRFTEALKRVKRGDDLVRRVPRSLRGQVQTLRHNSLVPIKNLIISQVNAQRVEYASRLNNIALRYLPRERDLLSIRATLRGAKRTQTRRQASPRVRSVRRTQRRSSTRRRR